MTIDDIGKLLLKQQVRFDDLEAEMRRGFGEVNTRLDRHEVILHEQGDTLLRHEQILLRHEEIMLRHEVILRDHDELLHFIAESVQRHDTQIRKLLQPGFSPAP